MLKVEDFFDMKNKVLSFDIAHWYESYKFRNIPYWKNVNHSDVKIIEQIIEILLETSNKATFFVTGKFAFENKKLINKAYLNGIEIASHSFQHNLLTNMNKKEIYDDLKKSKDTLEDIIGSRIYGFRAPKWSVNYNNQNYVYEILNKLGFKYDSSIFPFNFNHGPFKEECLKKFEIENEDFYVLPITTLNLCGLRIPQGGFYFRILPSFLSELSFKNSDKMNKYTHLFLHPYDLDPYVPWVKKAPLRVNLFKKYNTKNSFKNLNKILIKNKFYKVYDYILSKKDINN